MNIPQTINLLSKTSPLQLFKIKKFHDSTMTYARNYMATYCICTLFNIGFFDVLKEKNALDLNAFAKEKKINEKILIAICDYLFVLQILNRSGKYYSLSPKSEDLLKYSTGTFDFIYAYAPLFENLEALLKNEKKYNVDVFRREKFVAKATAEVSQFIPIPIVKDIIKRYNFKSVLDLGCGSAEFLLEISKNTNITSYGVDISKEAIDLAKELIDRQSLNNRVKVQVGDIFNIEQLKGFLKDVDVIISMFVLHEFLSPSEQKVINLLKKIRDNFPNKYFIICELSKFSPTALRARPTSIAEHHLFHALSNQGLMSVEGWREIFKKAGYNLIEEIRYDFAGQSYFILQ